LPANGGNADTVGGKTAEQIQQAAEETIPTAVNTALQAAKESGEFNGKSPVIEMSGTAEGTILRVVNADGGEEEVLIRDGRNGEPGLNGLSAYQVAEQQGFEGTAKEWLDSLIGPKGNDGISVTNAEINSNGQLVLSFSNGQSATLGKVVGTNGTNGVSATHSWNGTVLTITSASGTSSANLKGEKGDSIKGDDGISPTVAVSKSGKVTTISITDKNGTKTTTINDGADGKTPVKGTDYVDGKDGTSVTVSSVSESSVDGGSNVVTFSDGKKLNVKNGQTGTPGKTPVKGVDYFTEADKVEMVEDVFEAMEGIPSYWQTALDEGVEAINSAVETAGWNKSAFLFYTDAHWGYGSGMSPNLLKYLGKHTAINKTIFGGDFGNTYDGTDKTMDEWMEIMRSWKLAVRDIPNHHSVVGNHDRGDGGKLSAIDTDKELYGFLFAPEETSDIVRGGDFFYYIDEPSERTRYLYLNTGLCDFSDEQCKFAIEALKTTPAGWHIVAVSHIWFMYDDTSTPTVGSVPTNIQKVLNLFDAYNARATGSMTIESESNIYDFTDCGAWVEFCIGGHTHVDYNFTSTSGIPVILCQTDSKHLRGNLYTYTAGTTTESAVSGVVADYDAKKISVTRVGRGESREIEITNYIVNYTNVLTLAVDTDGTPFQNGKGYATDSRIGSGGLYIGNQPDRCVTGYIPIDATQDIAVCMKNVTMKTDSSYISNLGFALWNSTFERTVFIGLNNMLDSFNGGTDAYKLVLDGTNVIGFTIKANSQPTGSIYLTLCCDVIDDTSIITINEPIE
jgi:hypothetical protein